MWTQKPKEHNINTKIKHKEDYPRFKIMTGSYAEECFDMSSHAIMIREEVWKHSFIGDGWSLFYILSVILQFLFQAKSLITNEVFLI